MADRPPDEFYIGYLPQAPPGVSRKVRLAVTIFLALSAIIAVILIFGQRRFEPSFFEYGTEREFEGLVRARPIPLLLVTRPGATRSLPVHSRYALVASGKHGADEMTRVFHNHQVRLRGKLVYRDGVTMIEVVPDSIETLPSIDDRRLTSTPTREALGEQTLVGEIVDSKCYLGVMNPGELKPHRECAVRCLSGGVPPLFIVKNGAGESSLLWLVGVDGQAIGREVLDKVAEPIEIKGEVRRDGDQLFLQAEPSTFRRLP
jgi:hypothetical protein